MHYMSSFSEGYDLGQISDAICSEHSKLDERRLPKVSKSFRPLPSHKYVHLSDRQIWAFVDLEIWISLGSGVN